MTAALVALLMACGDVAVRHPVDVGEVDEAVGWERARAAVSRVRNCYRGWAAYCPDEPELIDGAIQHVLDRHFDGRMPTRERDVDEVTRDAVLSFTRWQRTDEGLRALEARIRAYYQDPEVERVEGRGVSVRIGVPPGRLSPVDGRPDAPIVVASPVVVRGEWDTREIARFLEQTLREHPDAPAVRLYVTIPSATGVRRMDIRYYRDLDRVVILDPDHEGTAWVSDRLGGDLSAYRSGGASLHTSVLRRCPADPSGRPRCDGPPASR